MHQQSSLLKLHFSPLSDALHLDAREQLGSGRTALVTLLHEGGHAAHMANIDQPSPFFGQERAPFRWEGTLANANYGLLIER